MGGHLVRRQLGPTPLAVVNGFGIFEGGHPHVRAWARAFTVGHHFFETMCPTAFLAPTLTAKTCFICTQPQNAFFQAQLAVQDNRANGKKSFPGRVPGPKKRTKMVPKSGPFQKEFFCSAAKKSPKNWTGPWLSLNMVNGN